MASLYKKIISGKPYWYLREMGWVDGKPKLVSERYLGSAADIEALLDAREAAALPDRTRHLGFGDVAAAWGMLEDLGVAGIIDEVSGGRRSDAGASVGTYLVLAALNRLVAPCSKLGFAGWWKTTAADRFTRIPPACWITGVSGMRCTRCRWRTWRKSAAGSRCGSWRSSGWTARRWRWT